MSLVYICNWLPPGAGAVGRRAMMHRYQRAERGCCGVMLSLGNRGVALDEHTFLGDDAGDATSSSNFLPGAATANAIR